MTSIDVKCGACNGVGGFRDGGDGYECADCMGSGKIEVECGPLCDSCGESSDNLQTVESRDDETGYYESAELCYDCRTAGRRADAEECGGLRPDALILLGVGPDWLELDAPAPRKPVTREPYFAEGGFFVEGSR